MNPSPKFTSFRVWEVAVPARADLIAASAGQATYSQALTWPQMTIHLVEAITDAGFTAVGESGRGESREAVERTLRELLGRDIGSFHPATVWSGDHHANGLPAPYPLASWNLGSGRSYAVLESLWLDAAGKAAGLPAHALLGGAVRDRVPVDFWANRPGATSLAKLVDEAVALGLHGIKLKGTAAGETAIAVAQVAKDASQGFHFTIDPMCAWRSFKEAKHFFALLAARPREVRIEDPFPHDAFREWDKAGRAFPHITLAWHARDEATLRGALERQPADVLSLSGSSALDFVQASSLARHHHFDCWHGSALELGVLQHWRLHASACAPNCILPCDLQSEWVREHTLVTPRMTYLDGFAVVPQTPGLGVALDHQAINRYQCNQWEISHEPN